MSENTTTLSPEALLALLRENGVSLDTLRAVVKSADQNKPTLASLTFDGIVYHGRRGTLLSDNVLLYVESKAREHGLLNANERANAASVNTLMRYATQHNDAIARADNPQSELGKALAAASEADAKAKAESEAAQLRGPDGQPKAPEPATNQPDTKPVDKTGKPERRAAA